MLPSKTSKSKQFKRRFISIARLFERKIGACNPAYKARIAIKKATESEKCSEFEQAIRDWMECLDPDIRRTFLEYVELAVRHNQPSDNSPLNWSEKQVTNALEKQFGRRPQPVWVDPDSQPHPALVSWVASAVSGDDLTHMRFESVTENKSKSIVEIDPERLAKWQCPSWLNLTSLLKSDSPSETSTLDARQTRIELLAVQRRFWGQFERALDTARREAQLLLEKLAATRNSDTTAKSNAPRRRSPPTPDQKVIGYAIGQGWVGERFCQCLDEQKVKPLPGWTGWPGSWVKAYKMPKKWKKLIQQMKNREARRAGKTKRVIRDAPSQPR